MRKHKRVCLSEPFSFRVEFDAAFRAMTNPYKESFRRIRHAVFPPDRNSILKELYDDVYISDLVLRSNPFLS